MPLAPSVDITGQVGKFRSREEADAFRNRKYSEDVAFGIMKKELSPRTNKAPAPSIYKMQGNLSSTGQMMIGPALVSGSQFKIIPQQVNPSRHNPRRISPVKKAR